MLVLWLNEDKLTTGPLMKLRSLIAELTPSQASSQPKPSNDSKQNLSVPARQNTQDVCTQRNHPRLRSWMRRWSKKPWDCFMMEPPVLLNKLTNLSIVRTIGTDDVLAAALLWELWQRGVNRNLAISDKWLTRKWTQL